MTAFFIENMAPIMFLALIVLLLLGYPVAFALAFNGLAFGLIGIELGLFPTNLFQALPDRLFGIMANETLLAIPFFTFMGLILIQILGGAVIIESVFALPGLGRLLLTSIETRDYPVLQGALLVVVVIAMAVNLGVDLLYRVIDPRVRLS